MQTFHKVLAVGGILGVGVIGWQMTKKPPVSIPVNAAITVADTAGFRGYVIGSDSAPVTIVEYADYQCPGCESFDAIQWPDVYEKLVVTGKVRWVYRDYPLDNIHKFARLAAHSAACAADQDKFWQMKARLYAYQTQWAFGTGQLGKFREYAQAVQVDIPRWDACMQAATYAGRIEASVQEGQRLGVQYTPSFVIGGRMYPGALGSDQVAQIVDSLIAAQPKAPAAR